MSYCVLFCVLYRKESANKRYRNTVNNLISPNTVSQNDEKPHTAELDDTAIPHVKIKITEIPHEKKSNIVQGTGKRTKGKGERRTGNLKNGKSLIRRIFKMGNL